MLGADGPSPTSVFFLSLQHCVFTLCQASKDIRRFLNHAHTRSERHLFHLTNISTHARANTNTETQKNEGCNSANDCTRARAHRTIKHMCRITLEVQIYSGVCFSHLLMRSLFCSEVLGSETSDPGPSASNPTTKLDWRIL